MLRFLEIDLPQSLKLKDDQLADEEDDQLFEELVPLDTSAEKIGADLRKFSSQFQNAILQCKQNAPVRKFSTSTSYKNILDQFKAEKVRIEVPAVLLQEYSVVPLLPVRLRDAAALRGARAVPAAPTREAALLKCASWLETNEQFVTRPASSRARAAWKREKNVVTASRRVKSSNS
ncbi:uncharacterized protein LOC135944260 [Cloeon dipterum]|uniref:uncharacterized protein LOC135944260 n=1 Tax=Cloeon dipterum TaxID=197152 RepID=UPI00321F940C